MSQNPKNHLPYPYKVYVSARWFERVRVHQFYANLVEKGVVENATSWFLNEKDDRDLHEMEKMQIAVSTPRQIATSDWFVHLHHGGDQRGGNLIELGMALAFGKTVIVVCPILQLSIFHRHPQVLHVESDAKAVEILQAWVKRRIDPSPSARGVVGASPTGRLLSLDIDNGWTKPTLSEACAEMLDPSMPVDPNQKAIDAEEYRRYMMNIPECGTVATPQAPKGSAVVTEDQALKIRDTFVETQVKEFVDKRRKVTKTNKKGSPSKGSS